ncbi:Alpha/Beta hydrolase protein [Dendryphion nanum]|uniref:Alpha/Beta hydrolase protein n=1 Tax=Dendryphion nanum TaxID=256645 RepID=A0A9P9EEA3_9PLEO|nr:Alpha/Beta hydrolase protein [Dendryphion nanum]
MLCFLNSLFYRLSLLDNTPPSSPPNPSKLILDPSECQTLTLPSGRTLGYATYGSTRPNSPVIFMFHGLPGSRLVGRGWDQICRNIGARLITMDRPGNGLSTLADRKLKDWPGDVLSLADHLGIKRFSVLGASGGGPFALACARFIPKERLRGTTVVCGIGCWESLPETVPYLSRRLFGLTSWILKILARSLFVPFLIFPVLTKDPARMKRVLENQCVTPEEKALVHNDGSGLFSLDDSIVQILEAFKSGTGGARLDGKVLTSDWGFDLRNVDSEKVWLVHGDQDNNAPLKMIQWIDERLGGGRLRILEGKGHVTIWTEHSEEIFRQSAEA